MGGAGAIQFATNGSVEINCPDGLDLRPGWIQCRIGPRMPNWGKGASMSIEMAM